jgi:hypothetical protein
MSGRKLLVLVVVFCGISFAFGDTRPTSRIDFERFIQDADVMVIAHPTSTQDLGPEHRDNNGNVVTALIQTRFFVKAVVKGKISNSIIAVRYSKVVLPAGYGIASTTNLARFRAYNGHAELDYLLFLKPGKDGVFTIINGSDPALATFVLVPVTHLDTVTTQPSGFEPVH